MNRHYLCCIQTHRSNVFRHMAAAVALLGSLALPPSALAQSAWVGTSWVDEARASNQFRVIDFDGEAMANGSIITGGFTYNLSGHCVNHRFSKDGMKILFSYSGCANSAFNGNTLVCERKVAPDRVQCSAGNASEFVVLRPDPGKS